MRVIHIVHGKCNPNEHNGISRVVYYLNKYEKINGINSEIWAVVDDAKKKYEKVRDEYVTVECYPRVKTGLVKNQIIEDLKKEKDTIDLVHFHMIWFYDKNIIANELKQIGIPYIITTHGTYSKPHAYTGKRLLVKKLYELDYLKKATAIHIITREEGTGLQRYGYNGPVFLGYNGIDKSEVPDVRRNDFFSTKPYNNKIKIGWVGVLRDDKNIVSLVQAVAMLPQEVKEKIVIILVGPDYKNNASKYLKMANDLGCRKQFDWVGPLYSNEKYNAIESFDAYVMPSFSEVLSLAVPDAMVCRKPVIVSTGCGYNYLIQDYKFGLLTEPYPYDISQTIISLLEKKDEWEMMGNEGYKCIQEQLNWESITTNVIAGYKKVLCELRG